MSEGGEGDGDEAGGAQRVAEPALVRKDRDVRGDGADGGQFVDIVGGAGGMGVDEGERTGGDADRCTARPPYNGCARGRSP